MYDEVSVGDRFGHYTVIAEATPAITLSKRRRWLCKCDCGNERIVEEPNLRHGKSTNCGCVRYRNKDCSDIDCTVCIIDWLKQEVEDGE